MRPTILNGDDNFALVEPAVTVGGEEEEEEEELIDDEEEKAVLLSFLSWPPKERKEVEEEEEDAKAKTFAPPSPNITTAPAPAKRRGHVLRSSPIVPNVLDNDVVAVCTRSIEVTVCGSSRRRCNRLCCSTLLLLQNWPGLRCCCLDKDISLTLVVAATV